MDRVLSFEYAILAKIGFIGLDLPPYNAQNANCNAFVTWLIESSGGEVVLPMNAFFGSRIDTFQERFDSLLSSLVASVSAAMASVM